MMDRPTGWNSGVIWMSGALLSFTFTAIGARELSDSLHTFQTLFFRSLIGLLLLVPIFIYTGAYRQALTQNLTLHGVRNAFHFLGQYGWFLGIGLLPLAEVFALEFTVPIWTLIVAAIFLKEPLTKSKLVAVGFGLIGVLVIVRPGLEIIDPASFIVIGAAMGYAVAYVATKPLAQVDSPIRILFFMCAMQLPVAFFCALPVWQSLQMIDWFWCFVVALTALTAHFCIAKAMQQIEAGVVVTLDFLRLPLIALIGVVFYHEGFDWWILLGGGLMLMGNIINIRGQRAG